MWGHSQREPSPRSMPSSGERTEAHREADGQWVEAEFAKICLLGTWVILSCFFMTPHDSRNSSRKTCLKKGSITLASKYDLSVADGEESRRAPLCVPLVCQMLAPALLPVNCPPSSAVPDPGLPLSPECYIWASTAPFVPESHILRELTYISM